MASYDTACIQGGTYFRDINSAVTGQRHTNAWKEGGSSVAPGLLILFPVWLHERDIAACYKGVR